MSRCCHSGSVTGVDEGMVRSSHRSVDAFIMKQWLPNYSEILKTNSLLHIHQKMKGGH